jgi:hypothetical protein
MIILGDQRLTDGTNKGPQRKKLWRCFSIHYPTTTLPAGDFSLSDYQSNEIRFHLAEKLGVRTRQDEEHFALQRVTVSPFTPLHYNPQLTFFFPP